MALGERFFHFTDFGFLEPAHLERKLFQRRAGNGDRAQQLGMPVALNHLRRHRRRLESERAAHSRLNRRVEMRVRTDRAGDFSDRDRSPRAPQPLFIALQLGIPECQLQPEGQRLGMHAVGAPDHRRLAMLVGTGPHGLGERFDILQQQFAGFAHLQRLRGGGCRGCRAGSAGRARTRACSATAVVNAITSC